jgi:hypothetical protein
MTQPCTIEETTGVGKDPDLDDALEAAMGLWSLIEVIDAQPLTTETRDQLSGARQAFDLCLQSLNWDEKFLRENLCMSAEKRDEPPEIEPPDWVGR